MEVIWQIVWRGQSSEKLFFEQFFYDNGQIIRDFEFFETLIIFNNLRPKISFIIVFPEKSVQEKGENLLFRFLEPFSPIRHIEPELSP